MPDSKDNHESPIAAVLDIGSNTCRLVLARLGVEGGFRIIDEVRASVRLASGIRRGAINRAALARAERAFLEFRAVVDSYSPEDRIYLATAAVRGATNSERVVKLFSQWLGAPVRVISSEEESQYAVLSASHSFAELTGTVVDLGGGSMQIATFLGKGTTSSHSVPAGALRLQQQFFGNGIARPRELKRLRASLRGMFADMPSVLPRPVIFLGGTARALARVHQRSYGYKLPSTHGYSFTLGQLSRLVVRLASLSVQERARLPGLSEERSDIILPGAVAIEEFCRRFEVDRLVISGEGIRQGVLYDLLERRGLLRGTARERTVVQILEGIHPPPYLPAASAAAAALLSSWPELDPLIKQLLPVAVDLHRIGYEVAPQRGDRSAQYILSNREMAGFAPREQMILACVLGSQEQVRLRPAECIPPLLPADFNLIAKMSSLLHLVLTCARQNAEVAFELRDDELHVRTGTLPFDAEEVGARLARYANVRLVMTAGRS